MRHDDLAPFAVADGILSHTPYTEGELSYEEQQYLCDRARENLAKVTGGTVQEASEALAEAAYQGDAKLRVGRQFATVVAFGRILAVYTRAALRGYCHPECN